MRPVAHAPSERRAADRIPGPRHLETGGIEAVASLRLLLSGRTGVKVMPEIEQQPKGGRVRVDFTLNGAPVHVDIRPDMPMLELLREACGITSVKDGCAPEGSCGACTVLMEGRAVVACSQLATRVAGRNVLTQEGVGVGNPDSRSDHPVRSADVVPPLPRRPGPRPSPR